MSMAYKVAKLLEAQSLGVFAATGKDQWSINVGIEPREPQRCITVYDTGGEGPDTDEMDIDQLTIQVRVRAVSRSEASAKLRSVRAYLLTAAPKTYDNTRIFGAFVTADSTEIGRDENDRALFTINFRTLSNEV